MDKVGCQLNEFRDTPMNWPKVGKVQYLMQSSWSVKGRSRSFNLVVEYSIDL